MKSSVIIQIPLRVLYVKCSLILFLYHSDSDFYCISYDFLRSMNEIVANVARSHFCSKCPSSRLIESQS